MGISKRMFGLNRSGDTPKPRRLLHSESDSGSENTSTSSASTTSPTSSTSTAESDNDSDKSTDSRRSVVNGAQFDPDVAAAIMDANPLGPDTPIPETIAQITATYVPPDYLKD